MSEPTRNQPCPCGSGLRFKECHGKPGDAAPHRDGAGERYQQVMARALAHRQHRRYDEAIRDYEAALEIDPSRHDGRYMLADLCRERGDGALAKAHIVQALDLTGWKSAPYRRFLSAILADESMPVGSEPVPARAPGDLAERIEQPTPVNLHTPLVTVIVPSRNHAQYVEAALRSIFRQTYRRVSLVVIDDGSEDGSAGVLRRCLAESPFEHRFIARAHRGAPETINEAAELASGTFICLLNSDDYMHEDRLRQMVANIAGAGAQWGFSATECVDANGNYIDPLHNRYVYDLCCATGDAVAAPTIGFALMTQNIAASSGNLFVSRELFRALGGFHSYRHVQGWDFCLRALQLAEPVFVRQAIYCKRLHRGNQPQAILTALRAEAAEVCGRYVRWGCSSERSVSPVAPCVINWPIEFRKAILETGLADLVDMPTLRLLALGRS